MNERNDERPQIAASITSSMRSGCARRLASVAGASARSLRKWRRTEI